MASKCPKCGRVLKITDLKPTCPGCDTNLLYYKIEERLEVDAINAELEHAKTQKKLDRALAALSSGPLAIIRDVLLVLAVAAFVLPLAKLSITGPFIDFSETYTAINLVETLQNFDFAFIGLRTSAVMGTAVTFFALSVILIVLAALMALLELIFCFLGSSPRWFVRNVIFSSLGIVFSLASTFAYSKFISELGTAMPGFASGSVAFGVYIVAAMFALVLAINIIIKVTNGIKINYKPCYVGKDQIPYEDFVAKYGDGTMTLETLLKNPEEFMHREALEKSRATAKIEAARDAKLAAEKKDEN